MADIPPPPPPPAGAPPPPPMSPPPPYQGPPPGYLPTSMPPGSPGYIPPGIGPVSAGAGLGLGRQIVGARSSIIVGVIGVVVPIVWAIASSGGSVFYFYILPDLRVHLRSSAQRHARLSDRRDHRHRAQRDRRASSASPRRGTHQAGPDPFVPRGHRQASETAAEARQTATATHRATFSDQPISGPASADPIGLCRRSSATSRPRRRGRTTPGRCVAAAA